MLLAMLLKQRMTLVLPHVRPVVPPSLPPSLPPSYLQDVPSAAAANVAHVDAANKFCNLSLHHFIQKIYYYYYINIYQYII
jgi:hypothetical protein